MRRGFPLASVERSLAVRANLYRLRTSFLPLGICAPYSAGRFAFERRGQLVGQAEVAAVPTPAMQEFCGSLPRPCRHGPGGE